MMTDHSVTTSALHYVLLEHYLPHEGPKYYIKVGIGDRPITDYNTESLIAKPTGDHWWYDSRVTSDAQAVEMLRSAAIHECESRINLLLAQIEALRVAKVRNILSEEG